MKARVVKAVSRPVRQDAVAHLQAKGAIGPAQVEAACLIRALVVEATGRTLSGVDPEAVKVDTSFRERDWLQLGTTDAVRTLRRLRSDIGADPFEIVVRVCGLSEPMALVALDFEEDGRRRAAGRAAERTVDHVSRTLRRALSRSTYALGIATRAPEGRHEVVAWIEAPLDFRRNFDQFLPP